jgi:hypothetical protein
MRRREFPFLALVLASACRSDPASARGVAERFLDAHYVDIDLGAAEDFVSGLAGKKLADERRLVEGQVIDESTRRPSVYYRLIEETPDGAGRSRFVYRATFTVDGAGAFDRRILLLLRREDGAWKVANFEEFD